jgi:hypothetical protein
VTNFPNKNAVERKRMQLPAQTPNTPTLRVPSQNIMYNMKKKKKKKKKYWIKRIYWQQRDGRARY